MGHLNQFHKRSQGRVCVLGTWFAFLSAVTAHALWSYASSRAPIKAGERRLLSRTSAEGVRTMVQHRSASVLDGRLLVRLLAPLGSRAACMCSSGNGRPACRAHAEMGQSAGLHVSFGQQRQMQRVCCTQLLAFSLSCFCFTQRQAEESCLHERSCVLFCLVAPAH